MPGEKILVVEDNVMNMELFVDLLECDGYSVLRAKTGDEALHIVGSELPDLILMDMRLPDMDGVDLLKKLREGPAGKVLFIVACTASLMDEQIKKVKGVGADGFLGKPIEVDKFSSQIRKFLERAKKKGGGVK